MVHDLYLVQLILKVLQCGLVGFNKLASGLGLLVSILTDFVSKQALRENKHALSLSTKNYLNHTWIGSAAAAQAGVLTEKHLLRTTADWRRDIIL